jgi:hypothetical protein
MKIDVGLDPHVCSLGTVLSQLPETTDSSQTNCHTSYISPNINESYKVQSGKTFSAHVWCEKCIQSFGWEAWREETIRKTKVQMVEYLLWILRK